MPVDYSKWDALELSDDSDFEPHPNVDKKSFIRAKQTQIHQQRAERKHQIETLKYERTINDGLLRRIETLLAELKGHESEAKDRDAFLYQALIASAGDADDDEAPPPPGGVHNKEGPIRYSQMMGSLADQVKKEVEESKREDWFHGYVKGVEGHRKKVMGLQKQLEEKLAQLEKEESRKITSEHIHDGFNSTVVNKDKGKAAAAKSGSGSASKKTVEVLNPGALNQESLDQADGVASGAEADIDEDIGALQKNSAVSGPVDDEDEDSIEPSALGKQFARIKYGDYKACLAFISENPEILSEKETDGLLVEGFDAQMKGKTDYAKLCVHQALLIQYCRALGRDGVGLFFKRITTPNHQANKVFLDDVTSTYTRIKERVKVILAERAADTSNDVEQIQLQAMEPGTEIHFNIPQPNSEEEIEKQARAVFESFPPGLQRALESGSLDRVNEVLGKMSVDEAEEIVGQLGESGMLDMREGVIDGTTEEGKAALQEIQQKRGAGSHAPKTELAPDPE